MNHISSSSSSSSNLFTPANKLLSLFFICVLAIGTMVLYQLDTEDKEMSGLLKDINGDIDKLNNKEYNHIEPSAHNHAGVGTTTNKKAPEQPNLENNIQTGEYLSLEESSLYLEQLRAFPYGSKVVRYWPISRYHSDNNVSVMGIKAYVLDSIISNKTILRRKDLVYLRHFIEFSKILDAAKLNIALDSSIGATNEVFLLIQTKDIVPIISDPPPPIYNLLKQVKINNTPYDVIMGIRANDDNSYLVVSYIINESNKQDKSVVIENINGGTQEMLFKYSALTNRVCILTPKK